MPYGGLSVFVVISLAFSPCAFSVEPVESGLLVPNTPSDTFLDISYEQLQIELAEQIVQGKQFQNLEAAIGFYQSLEQTEQWRPIEEGGPLLSLGATHPQVAKLRVLLSLYGDLDQEAATLVPLNRLDTKLHIALLKFQKRHGAKVDGILGPKTRRLLNISPQQRIDQLFLNIHRQQQLQVESGKHYLQVNIPEYRLRLYDQGEILLEMKTIIGRRSRQTPTFSAEIKSLVLNPSWNVPKSIAYRDILPKWKKDKTYLSRHNLRVVAGWALPRVIVPDDEIDLVKMYRGSEYYRLWEPPSMQNTLGRLKFQVSSDNSIYLHDTKKPHLFNAEMRAFSSGCIRLEKPRILADALLQHANQWQPQQLDPLLETMETHRIRFENPISLHVTYWTAWLDEHGILNFADDLYQRDSVDLAQLKNQRQQVALQFN